MKNSAEKLSLVVRTLLLIFCCTLFMPQGLHAEHRQDLDDSIRVTSSLTLAFTGITDPVSQIQKPASHEGTSLRRQNPRTGIASANKRSSFSHTAKRDGQDIPDLADDSSPFALPSVPPLPGSFSCAKAPFSFRVLLPDSHGHIHWYALAPPASRNV